MTENLEIIEKGVNKMGIEIRSGNEAIIDRRKGVSGSPIVQQDINSVFNFGGITQYMTADNAFYRYIHQHYADKSNCKIPYLVDSKVLRADGKYLKCVADGHIKISPYGFYEGVSSLALNMYQKTMQQLSCKVNFVFLIQAYFLYTALCVGISNNGKIDLITSGANIINSIPASDNDRKSAIQRANPVTDDYNNGIVQCVELIQKPFGYVLHPAIINAAKQDYLVLPLEWVNYLISYIHNILKVSVCKISYYDPNNQLQTIVASNKPIRGNPRHIISCDYIRETKNCVGWIRAVDIKTGDIISFPVSHFFKIEPLK